MQPLIRSNLRDTEGRSDGVGVGANPQFHFWQIKRISWRGSIEESSARMTIPVPARVRIRGWHFELQNRFLKWLINLDRIRDTGRTCDLPARRKISLCSLYILFLGTLLFFRRLLKSRLKSHLEAPIPRNCGEKLRRKFFRRKRLKEIAN